MSETATGKSTYSFIYRTQLKLKRKREREREREQGNKITLIFKLQARCSDEFNEILACVVKYEIHNLRLRPILKPT